MTSGLPNIALYGTQGSVQVPNPNRPDGPVRLRRTGLHGWTEYTRTHPYREGARGVGAAVLAWHRQEQTRRRKALGQLGADLDNEIIAG